MHRVRQLPDYLQLEPTQSFYIQKKGEIVEEKLCERCGRWKELCFFSPDMLRKDFLSDGCKDCEKEKRTERMYRGRKVPHRLFIKPGEITIQEKDGEFYFAEGREEIIEKKICSICQRWIFVGKFHKDQRAWDGLNSACKRCKLYHIRERKKSLREIRMRGPI